MINKQMCWNLSVDITGAALQISCCLRWWKSPSESQHIPVRFLFNYLFIYFCCAKTNTMQQQCKTSVTLTPTTRQDADTIRQDITLLCHYKTSRIRVRWRVNIRKGTNSNNSKMMMMIVFHGARTVKRALDVCGGAQNCILSTGGAH